MDRSLRDGGALQCWEVLDRALPGAHQLCIQLWGGGLDFGTARVGVLLVADHPLGGRDHAGVRRAPRWPPHPRTPVECARWAGAPRGGTGQVESWCSTLQSGSVPPASLSHMQDHNLIKLKAMLQVFAERAAETKASKPPARGE